MEGSRQQVNPDTSDGARWFLAALVKCMGQCWVFDGADRRIYRALMHIRYQRCLVDSYVSRATNAPSGHATSPASEVLDTES